MNTIDKSDQNENLRDGGDEPMAFGPDEDIRPLDFGMLDDEDDDNFQEMEIDPEAQ
jgi:hypothetical protein